jgi:hypothetical protein
MTKIIFLCRPNDMSLEDRLEALKFQTPNNSGIWKTIQATTNINEADYYILVEHFPKEFQGKIDISRTIYFRSEPDAIHNDCLIEKRIKKAIITLANSYNDIYDRSEIKKLQEQGYPALRCKERIAYWARQTIVDQIRQQEPILENKDNFFAYFDYNNYRHPTVWWSRIPFAELNNSVYTHKPKLLSCIMSMKKCDEVPGYNIRLKYLDNFVRAYGNKIDVYGWGTENKTHPSYKGPLNYNKLCNAKAFQNYKYTFLCENCNDKGQISDRINDCLLNWSMPIYWGASNIYEYYPKNALYTISIESVSVQELFKLAQRPITDVNINAIATARQLILHKYNIWEKIYQTIMEK